MDYQEWIKGQDLEADLELAGHTANGLSRICRCEKSFATGKCPNCDQ
jgi:hypothetical protein